MPKIDRDNRPETLMKQMAQYQRMMNEAHARLLHHTAEEKALRERSVIPEVPAGGLTEGHLLEQMKEIHAQLDKELLASAESPRIRDVSGSHIEVSLPGCWGIVPKEGFHEALQELNNNKDDGQSS